MPKFVNAAHRRNWTAAIRRAAARRRDALAAGAELGRKPANEFERAKQKYVVKNVGVAGLNGTFDTMLNALRIDRVRADDQVTRLDAAIKALEAIRPAHEKASA